MVLVEPPPLFEAEVFGDLVAVEDEDPLVDEGVGGGLERRKDVVRRFLPDEVALEVEGVEADAYLP